MYKTYLIKWKRYVVCITFLLWAVLEVTVAQLAWSPIVVDSESKYYSKNCFFLNQEQR
jgi:hypothetical protein